MYRIKNKKSQKIAERIIGIILFLCLFLNSISYANETLEIDFNANEAELKNNYEESYGIEPNFPKIPKSLKVELMQELNDINKSITR